MYGKLGELIGSGEEEGKVVALLIEGGVVVCCNVGEECVDGMLRKLDRRILDLAYVFASERLRLPYIRTCLCSTRRVFVIQHRRHNNLSSFDGST
jgi:hypothetical protein